MGLAGAFGNKYIVKLVAVILKSDNDICASTNTSHQVAMGRDIAFVVVALVGAARVTTLAPTVW